VRDWFK